MRRVGVALLGVWLAGCFDFRRDLAGCVDAGACEQPTTPAVPLTQGAVCTEDRWCWSTRLPHTTLSAVVSLSATNAWAFGELGTVLRFDGTDWVFVGGLSGNLRDAVAFGPDELFVAGDALWRWDGARWSVVSSDALNLRALSGIKGTDLYLVPDTGGADHLLHWDGTRLTREALPMGVQVVDVFAAAGSRPWAVGKNGAVVSRQGSAWVQESNIGTTAQLNAVWASGDEVWAAGEESTIIHRQANGGWQVFKRPCPAYYDVIGASPNDVWFVGFDGFVSHWDGSTLRDERPARSDAYFGVTTTPTGVVVVGKGGAIVTRRDGSWSGLLNNGTTGSLTAVHGSSAVDVWAVGEKGLATHFDGTSWEAGIVAPGVTLQGVFSPSPGVAWAVSSTGELFRRKDDRWATVTGTGATLRGVWAASGDAAWVVGEQNGKGFVAHRVGAATIIENLDTEPLFAVTGASDDDVWVVGAKGVVFHRVNAAWVDLRSRPDETLTAVVLDGPDDVWVAGGGTFSVGLFHRVRGAWVRLDPPASGFPLGLSTDHQGGVWVSLREGVIGRANASGTSTQASGTSAQLNAIFSPSADVAFVVGEQGVMLQRSKAP